MFQRRGTTAEWAAANSILASGEIGLDLTLMRIKVGDGITAWLSLEFYAPPGHEEAADPHPQYATDSDLSEAIAGIPPGFMPTKIASGSTFTIPAEKQALFAFPISCEGILVVDGMLVEVN